MMKKRMNITVDKPCSEDWNQFTKTASGGFCQSCQKDVIDFTRMNDQQIIDYFTQGKSNICGRFQKKQLKDYTVLADSPNRSFFKPHWLSIGIMGFALIFNQNEASASGSKTNPYFQSLLQVQNTTKNVSTKQNNQELIISGKVVDEEGYELAGATVLIKGTQNGTICDLKGEFELKGIKPGDILICSFVGYKTLEYRISNTEINLFLEMELEAELMGEIVVGGAYAVKPGIWQRVKSLFNRP